MAGQPPRTIEEIRELIASMPFAATAGIEIEEAAPEQGVASLPLSPVVAFTDDAFAGTAVGLVADMAAGAATLARIPGDRMPLTLGVDATVVASTKGERLQSRAQLREELEGRLIYEAEVFALLAGSTARRCGTAVITIKT